MGIKPKLGRFMCLTMLAMVMPGLAGCDKARGIAAVKQLCEKDGGERIFDTTYVPGYATYNNRSHFCSACIELLGDRKFKYLDAEVDMGNGVKSFFRYSLGKSGDARCETWSRQLDAPRLLRELDIREDECVIASELAGPPDGYTYARHGSTVDIGDRIQVAVDNWEISHAKSGAVLARVRDYQFTSKMTSLLDMSGHGGNPDATCFDPGEKVRSVVTLPERVLRDESKRADKIEGGIR